MHNEGGFQVPHGGWVTQAQRQHPDIHLGVIDRGRDWRNQMCDVRHFHDGDCGPDWYHHDHGFFAGDAFWFGFDMGLLTSPWEQPVYIVSPVTGDDCGQIAPPDSGSGFDSQDAAYQAILNIMANPAQDANDPNFDPTAGLYVSTDNFDPSNPGQQLSGGDAFNALSSGQPIYFHPPNGDWEQINSTDDLNGYLYTQEQQAGGQQ